jgi:hypothetical protein
MILIWSHSNVQVARSHQQPSTHLQYNSSTCL